MSERIPYLKETTGIDVNECLEAVSPFVEYADVIAELGGVFNPAKCVEVAELPGGSVEVDYVGGVIWWVRGTTKTYEPLGYESLARVVTELEKARNQH